MLFKGYTKVKLTLRKIFSGVNSVYIDAIKFYFVLSTTPKQNNNSRNRVFATNPNPIYLQHEGVNLWYFKLRLLIEHHLSNPGRALKPVYAVQT